MLQDLGFSGFRVFRFQGFIGLQCYLQGISVMPITYSFAVNASYVE